MVILGVVSDTHLPRFGRSLPRALLDGLAAGRVDSILHAGDITASFVLDQLAEIAPVLAVAGNNDPADLVETLGTRRVLEVAGRRIGLTHGHLGPGATTPERALRAFAPDDVDVVVFGHSHRPLWIPADTDGGPAGSGAARPALRTRRGLQGPPSSPLARPALLNPGSPTDRRREPTFSFALLELDRGELRGRIERYTDRAV